jgi:hypothetical protein
MTNILCPCCLGEGKIPLSVHLEETLAIIPKSGSITAPEIADALSITASNATHRLLDLKTLGKIDRERNGVCWHYRRIANHRK